MHTIYISDLDGTLINRQAELSGYARENLRELLADGLPFTVASARSIVSIKQILRGLDLSLPVICFNGAFISDLQSGRHEIVNAMQSDVAAGIYGLLPDYNCIPFLSTYTGAEEKVFYNEVTNAGMEWFVQERFLREDPRFSKTSNLREGLSHQVMCMTIVNRKEVLDDLEQDIGERFGDEIEMHHFENEYSPGWYWLTIHDARASKDQAVVTLKTHCGLADSRIVAFGDHGNDSKMLAAADHGIAVANAKPQAMQHADEVIGSNLEDGVVNYLLEQWRA
jgi:5-amino-6-(5-phospho-D-ribitylamino)uracil phosphatase